MTDHANGGTTPGARHAPDPIASTPESTAPAVRVPLTDERHQVTAVLVVRGPWAELLGRGAAIRILDR